MSTDLKKEAQKLLNANTHRSTYNGKVYAYTVPSNDVYPFQWFWDSCFHAIAWSYLDIDRAKEEIRSLLSHQEDSGFIPHVTFWNQDLVNRFPFDWRYLESKGFFWFLPLTQKPQTSVHIQPPVIAQAVESVYQKSDDDKFLNEVLPSLEKYYRWLTTFRDPDGDGLISITAQFESGLDFSPAYDPEHGIFRHSMLSFWTNSRWVEVKNKLIFNFDLARIFKYTQHHREDVLVNSIFIQGLESLSRLSKDLDKRLSNWAEDQARMSLEALIAKCFDPQVGLFWNLVGKEEKQTKVKTIISLMPLIIRQLPKKITDRLVEHLSNSNEFLTPYPVASVSQDEPSFKSNNRLYLREFIWRGSLSINTNWFLVNGLRHHGYHRFADKIAKISKQLVERYGFSEFYDSLTGEPVGAKNFGWATLVVDL